MNDNNITQMIEDTFKYNPNMDYHWDGYTCTMLIKVQWLLNYNEWAVNDGHHLLFFKVLDNDFLNITHKDVENKIMKVRVMIRQRYDLKTKKIIIESSILKVLNILA